MSDERSKMAEFIRSSPVGARSIAVGGGWWLRNETGWEWNGPEGNSHESPGPSTDWNGQIIYPEGGGYPASQTLVACRLTGEVAI